jgi:hypothetical protein
LRGLKPPPQQTGIKMRCAICNKPMTWAEEMVKDPNTGEPTSDCARCRSKSAELYSFSYDKQYEQSDVTERNGSKENGSRYFYEYYD